MAKNMYIGVDSVARKIKQPDIGVANVARKVTNGYIGVDNVARQFYSGASERPLRLVLSATTSENSTLQYYTATALASSSRWQLYTASIIKSHTATASLTLTSNNTTAFKAGDVITVECYLHMRNNKYPTAYTATVVGGGNTYNITSTSSSSPDVFSYTLPNDIRTALIVTGISDGGGGSNNSVNSAYQYIYITKITINGVEVPLGTKNNFTLIC